MDEIEHLHIVKIKLWKYGLLSVAAFLPPFITVYYPLMPEGETTASWFQRSGSLMVIIAIWTEYKLFSMNDYFDLHDTRYVVPIDLPKTYKQIYTLITIIAALAMVFGTLIWGYGDVFIKNT